MADLETLKTRLAEAEDALHALNLGERVVEVMRDGRRMRYQESNRGGLEGYIGSLRAQVAESEITPRSRRRFIPVAFR